ALDQDELAQIGAEYAGHLRVIQRRVASIDDPVRREQAELLLQSLDKAIENQPQSTGLFQQRADLISIDAELSRLTDDNRRLSTQVSDAAQAMLRQSEQFALATAAQAAKSVEPGLYALIASTLIALLISGLIVWLYVERKVVKRLAGL